MFVVVASGAELKKPSQNALEHHSYSAYSLTNIVSLHRTNLVLVIIGP